MDMISVSSTNIAAVGYDEADQTLRVQFNNGRTYEYAMVPVTVYDDLIAADSVGRYFNAHVKNVFDAVEV